MIEYNIYIYLSIGISLLLSIIFYKKIRIIKIFILTILLNFIYGIIYLINIIKNIK